VAPGTLWHAKNGHMLCSYFSISLYVGTKSYSHPTLEAATRVSSRNWGLWHHLLGKPTSSKTISNLLLRCWLGGDEETLQSISGYMYLLSSEVASLRSKKQEWVTPEAKYVVMTLAFKKGTWLKTLLERDEIIPGSFTSSPIENMSAVMLVKNQPQALRANQAYCHETSVY
jgi:hypothetical protein